MNAIGTDRKIAASWSRELRRSRRAGHHEVAEHARGIQAALLLGARRMHVAHELGTVPGLTQHLGHEPTDVEIVFDDQDDFVWH